MRREAPAVIEIEHVSKSFTGGHGTPVEVLRDIELRVEAGSFVCLVGPSGCGKSTLLNMIAGLVAPTAGTVSYRGSAIASVNTRAGYITQKDNLLPWRTLEHNVELGLELQHVPRRERRARVADMLARVALSAAARLYPAQLSGGMRKRASLARTLIYRPETLLLDEPFAAVDAILRLSLHDVLMRLWQETGVTIVFVTHDLEEALLLADRVVVFGRDPGRIIHVEEVPFGRPRRLLELRGDPAFGATWLRLWSHLAAGQTARTAASLGPGEARS